MTFRIWQIDEVAVRSLEPELSETRRACIYGEELDLDQTGDELGEILESLGLDNPFDDEELSVKEVTVLAKTLEELNWEALGQLLESLDSVLPDEDYCRPYYEDFRILVLQAAALGNSLAIEAS